MLFKAKTTEHHSVKNLKLIFFCLYLLLSRLKPQETVFLSRRSRRVSDHLEDERDSSEPQWLFPDNIWLRIFSYLSLQERTQASYVCQRWNNLCKDSLFWREVDFKFCGAAQPITNETVKAVTSYSTGIQSIDLSGDHCKPITDEAIGHVARSCPRLQRLNIAGRTKVSNRGLTVIARNCPLLKELDVEKCHEISNNGIKSIASRCRELKSLSVARCHKITDKGMCFVAQECNNLQRLSIAGCSRITDKSLTTLGKHCDLLRDINLKDIQSITSYGIERLVSGNPNLTHVHLGIVQDTKITLATLQIIVKHCEKLEFLSFQHFHRAGVVTGGVRKVNKKKLGAFINNLNACVVSNNNR